MANTESRVPHHGQSQSQVQGYINNTLAATLEELSSPQGRPAIVLKRRSKMTPFFINPNNGALETNETETRITYTWPGKNAHEAWRFSMWSPRPGYSSAADSKNWLS